MKKKDTNFKNSEGLLGEPTVRHIARLAVYACHLGTWNTIINDSYKGIPGVGHVIKGRPIGGLYIFSDN